MRDEGWGARDRPGPALANRGLLDTSAFCLILNRSLQDPALSLNWTEWALVLFQPQKSSLRGRAQGCLAEPQESQAWEGATACPLWGPKEDSEMLILCLGDSCLGFPSQAPAPPSKEHQGPLVVDHGKGETSPCQLKLRGVCLGGAHPQRRRKLGGFVAAPTAAERRAQKIWRPLALGRHEGSCSRALPCPRRLALLSESSCGGEGLQAQMCPPAPPHPSQLQVAWAPTTQFRALREGRGKDWGGGRGPSSHPLVNLNKPPAPPPTSSGLDCQMQRLLRSSQEPLN